MKPSLVNRLMEQRIDQAMHAGVTGDKNAGLHTVTQTNLDVLTTRLEWELYKQKLDQKPLPPLPKDSAYTLPVSSR